MLNPGQIEPGRMEEIMNRISFGSMESVEGIPVLEVFIKNIEDDKILGKGYLAPFRQYCFQVSGTKEGSGDYGSSEVIGLKHCKVSTLGEGVGFQSNNSPEEVTKELLLGQAVIAVVQYAAYNSNLKPFVGNVINNGKMSDFIDEVYNYLFK